MRHRPSLPRLCTSMTACFVATAVVATAGTALPLSAGASAPATQGSTGPASTMDALAGTEVPSADEVRVADLAVPSVDSGAGTALVSSLGPRQRASGALAAHLRRPVTSTFSLLGVVWDRDAAASGLTVELRTRSTDGKWGTWRRLEADADSGSGTSADPSQVKDGTVPVWVGTSSGVEVAAFSPDGTAPAGLSVSMIDTGTSRDLTTSARRVAQPARRGTMPAMPRVVTRRQWGADESLSEGCDSPRYGKTFKAAIVHHTVGSNNYSRRDSAAIVRGVYAYHTQSQGWCDIGYNFLIDKFGTVFEGRDGGIRRPVRGAHAGDYNVNTTGISMMGNFETARPSEAMKRSLVALVAWRLGTAYHGAYGHPFVYDHRIKRISGHRNVMATACPGRHVYAWLPTLRKKVNNRLSGYHSPIRRVWSKAGAGRSRLGQVSRGEQAENRGRHTSFQQGRMYSSSAGVKTFFSGPVLARYLSTGETDGPLGYPTSNVWRLDGPGQSANFARGRIYYSPRSGANALERSPVLKKYIAVGGVRSRLGFPRSRVIGTRHGSFATFQHGVIRFVRSTGRVIVDYR